MRFQSNRNAYNLKFYIIYFNLKSYERSKALLEKTKYSVIDTQLKKNEKLLSKQKEANFYKRLNIEENKITVMKKKLDQSKQ